MKHQTLPATPKMPHIETQRLILRAHIESDRARYLEALNDWSVVQWFFGIPYPHRDEDFENRALELAENHMSPMPSMFAVALKSDETLVGCVTLEKAKTTASTTGAPAQGCSPEDQEEMRLGYWFHPQSWGKGYATEATHAVMNYARDELKLSQVFATVDPSNPVSLKLLTGLGFVSVGWEERSQSRRGPVSMQRFYRSLVS